MLAARLQQTIYEIIRYTEVINQHYMEPHGVTVTQGYTLLAFPLNDNISMSALSDKLGLANSTVTRMVDQLVSKGLVRREPDPEDRRVVQVGLTAQGQGLHQALAADFQHFFSMVLAEIPLDQQTPIIDSLELVTQLIIKVMEQKHQG